MSRDPILTNTPLSSFRALSRRLPKWLAVAAVLGAAWLPLSAQATENPVSIVSFGPGKTPFINLVQTKMQDTSLLDHVQFTVAPKPGSVTRPVSAIYSADYLTRRGHLNASTGGITVPVFGLYAGYQNSVKIAFTFVNGVTQVTNLQLTAPPYISGVFGHPAIVNLARTKSTKLSYDFIEIKSYINPHSPTIVDSDGELRWVGTSDTASSEAIFIDNSFFVVKQAASSNPQGGVGTVVLRNEFDGGVSTIADYAPDNVTEFHHNFDFGKTGILTGVTTPEYVESTIMEIDLSGNILQTWDMAQIITDAMVAGGDDPTQFVAASGSMVDWFHNNSNTYRPSDNTIIISSRENFVIALDYDTKAIKWIIGDPNKQWHTFPSLAKYTLQGTPGTHPPIGQHAVSVYQDNLLLFDDGYYSADHTPKGINRTYSAPRKYSIDLQNRTYTEIWNYLPEKKLYSPITSSVYEDRPGDYLVDYSVLGPYKFSDLIGLDPTGAKVFDYEYTVINTADTAWNAVPVHLENLVFY
jgi:arylsulfate sulfotransferase